MSMSWGRVAWWALGGAAVGVIALVIDAGGELAMNPLGIVSFAALGACLGCLQTKDEVPGDPWF